MKENKDGFIANFNCTFGDEDKPMLNYFEEIILPAFKKGYVRKKKGNSFTIENVHLTMQNGIFMLVGLFVKSTFLEVRSRRDENGNLQRTEDNIKADPYSYFIINLKNHRMALVKNQKGSPSLSEFGDVAEYYLKNFVRETNKANKGTDTKELPKPNLHVVAVPLNGKIKEELNKVEKIQRAVFRFYPLNGDIPQNEIVNELRSQLPDFESKSGNVQINSPKNIDKVGETLEETKGLVKPSIAAEYPDGTTRTLNDENFTERATFSVEDSLSFNDNLSTIAGKAISKNEFKETSEENKNIYQRFFDRLENILSRK
ncbi:hypothetical protein [Pontibacillus salipaludis]|uniref:Uncharacterized protein n=1 Tax=Pontibacillus salipaludis TaxID=1697394 RepID=A0ABQ1PIB2_9BACI|nr:hypothetical protein [Pontibacillus salipaludis]GGC97817.1 hypothetical protein GCM10011389_01180 [Pontibacillus salipaludis]